MSRRTSTTHFSRIARRLANETSMGYQKALTLVLEQGDQIMAQGPRLDAAGCDMALRFLLKQDIEYWGPGVGAHVWPDFYHPVSMELLRSGLCEEAMAAADRARGQDQPEPYGSDFDPAHLAAAGVEPLDYGDGLDEGWEDEPEDIDPALLEPVDEPDRWRRHVLTQGIRTAYRLPAVHCLPPALCEELRGADSATTRLDQVLQERPAAAEAFVLRAELVLRAAREHRAGDDRSALNEARRWYECAVAVAEVPLHFPLYGGAAGAGGVLLWREEANRPLLRALYGLASVAHQQRRWNTAEMVLMRLLYLDPDDPQQAGALLKQVRSAVGIVQPDEADASDSDSVRRADA
ncbi:hypothetical protein [Streptomyces anulatus]|uniref:hypothetical protein n=1 Tax=Streptomyces anulatus TaxID=1892 RepID=UPI001C267DCD|nr:hypothetical protein [Streptomyces anulatus]